MKKLRMVVAAALALAALNGYLPFSTNPWEVVSTSIFFLSPPSSSPSPSPSPFPACGDGWHRCSCLLAAPTSRKDPCGGSGVEHTVELAVACQSTAATNTSRKVVTHAFSKAELSEQFTVVILSLAWRVALLQQVLREYDGRPSIAEIIVVMNGLSEDHVVSRLGVTRTPISFVNDSINSLNSRFAVAHQVRTEAVLENDDDLFFTPQSAAYLFRIWQRHRRSIVGSTVRFCGDGLYRMRDHCYNTVLTNGAFLSTDLMREYFKPTGPAAQVRAHVDEHQNCEDIGINFVAAAATEPNMDPPVFVKVSPVLIEHSKGLSDNKDHYKERRACGSAFTGFFGGLQLPNISHTYILKK